MGKIIETITKLMANSSKNLASAKKLMNEKTKDFKEQDYNKKTVKTAIIVTCIFMSPVILLLGAALVVAIFRFVPTWIIVAVAAGVAVRKIYKKSKSTECDIVDIEDSEEV